MSETDTSTDMDSEAHYRDSLVELAQALILAISTSQATRNLPSGGTGKRYWASILFARLCGIGGSLQRILPGSASNKQGAVWDSTSALSLCRSMFEVSLALFYLCFDKMTDEDYALRILLIFLHDSKERPRILSKISGETDAEAGAFYAAEGARLRVDIAANVIFQSLPEWKQKRLLEGKTPYYLSQDELLERQGIEAERLRGVWEFLSSHAHSYPFSFYRSPLNPDRGTGRENSVDKGFSAIAAKQAAAMLSTASDDMAALFPDVESIPRCIIDWDTLVCRAVKGDVGFVFGMSSPAAFETSRSIYTRAAGASTNSTRAPPGSTA